MTAVSDWLKPGCKFKAHSNGHPATLVSSCRMGRPAGIALLILCLCGCAVGASPGSLAARSPSPSPSSVLATAVPTVIPASPAESPSPLPTPLPVPTVFCHGGGGASSMVLLQSRYFNQQLLYDVSDPLHPRLLCRISYTSAHLFTGDTFEYLKPVSATETDVMLHSLGSGNESHAGKFPFYVTSGSWLSDQTVMAYTMPQAADNANFPSGGTQVWLYAQRRTALLYTYRTGIGDCI